MKTSHPLVGKYIFITDDKFYKYGKITDCIDEESFLIQVLSGDMAICTYSLYHISEMLQHDGDQTMGWQFFNTKASLDKYLKLIQTPTENTENKVLQLVKNKTQN